MIQAVSASVRHQLRLAFGIVIAISFLSTGLAIWRLNALAGDTQALTSAPLAKERLISNWLRPIRELSEQRAAELVDLDPSARNDRLCELNVIEQVVNVCQSTVMRDTWRRRQDLTVHGWIYDISDGLLRDLRVTVDGGTNLQERVQGALAG